MIQTSTALENKNTPDKVIPPSEAHINNANITQKADPSQDPFVDNFFALLENTKPYFKAAFQGFAGSGKTYTAARLALGLHQKIQSTKPVVIFDTEKAAKFLLPMFTEAGVQVLVKESRSLADLRETMKRCREGFSDVLIIDSLTHVYEDFLAAYKKKVGRQYFQIQDWGMIKPTWKQEFSDPFVRDPYHAIFCGRAGYEYDQTVNEVTGKKEFVKSGIKMKVEGETAYEPDILVLMERFEEVLEKEKKVWREATIIKDRSTLIDGKTFLNPTFEHFSPAIDAIIANPSVRVTEAEKDAATLFKTEEDKRQWVKEKTILLEEIQGYLVHVWPGQSAEDKKNKADAIDAAFNTRSWTAVEDKSPNVLREGFEVIKAFGKRYIESQKPQEESPAAKAMRKGMEKTKKAE